jgi:hypothetical protein
MMMTRHCDHELIVNGIEDEVEVEVERRRRGCEMVDE